MLRKAVFFITVLTTLGVAVLMMEPTGHVFAHCDTLDGPVVIAAKVALENGDVTPLLKWVRKDHEEEIREAFEKTLKVRTNGPEAKELADMYFFETIVRVHRAGEGAPYAGLKQSGTVEPAIAAADKALQTGSVDTLADKISTAVNEGIKKRFETALEKKKHADNSVEAGRAFIEAYVQYVHFIEGIHDLVTKGVKQQHGAEKSH